MKYRLIILCATLIWGSTFVLIKNLTDSVPPAWILGIRFTCAAVILALVFLKRRALYFDRGHVLGGLACGLALFTAYYFQTIGITDTTPGKNAFLTSVYCVIVPFLAWITTKRHPTRFNLVAAVLCVAGVGFISLSGGNFALGFGDAMTLVGAFFFALHIVLVAKVSQGRDIYVITMWQFAAVGACSWIAAFAFEKPPIWADVSWEAWTSLAYLTVMATAVALLFQNIGQAHLPPASASLLLSTEAVFGVAFSVAVGAEQLSVHIVIGFVLVFAGILVSEVLPEKLAESRERRERSAKS